MYNYRRVPNKPSIFCLLRDSIYASTKWNPLYSDEPSYLVLSHLRYYLHIYFTKLSSLFQHLLGGTLSVIEQDGQSKFENDPVVDLRKDQMTYPKPTNHLINIRLSPRTPSRRISERTGYLYSPYSVVQRLRNL